MTAAAHPQNTYTLVGRFDYNLSDKTQMFFRAGAERGTTSSTARASFSAYPQYDVGSLNPEPELSIFD